MPKKVSIILGTRPEAIKLAPVILALKQTHLHCQVVVTGQHRQMLDQVLDIFSIRPDFDLDLMQPNQTLAGFMARATESIDRYLEVENPHLVLVQGDTATVLSSALATFFRKVPLGHVEAGLRTWNLQSPWPEEANRVLTSRLASLHFAPTETARQNLIRENISETSIFVTGNTVIDALFLALEKVKIDPPHIPNLPASLQPARLNLHHDTSFILITGHRRESFGEGFKNICFAIAELAMRFPAIHFIYPVHLNPHVREPVMTILGKSLGTNSGQHAEWLSHLSGTEKCMNFTVSNIHLIEPLSYLSFIALMSHAKILLTDSGGVQEEAPSLGKPLLLMRDTTERPEAVASGNVKLVGTNRTLIVEECARLLTDPVAYQKMAQATNPYGDGKAVGRIIQVITKFLDERTDFYQ